MDQASHTSTAIEVTAENLEPNDQEKKILRQQNREASL
jgi:hypothetical protein